MLSDHRENIWPVKPGEVHPPEIILPAFIFHNLFQEFLAGLNRELIQESRFTRS